MRYGVLAIILMGMAQWVTALASASPPEVPDFPAPDPALVSEIPIVPATESQWKLPPPLPPVDGTQTVTRQRPIDLTVADGMVPLESPEVVSPDAVTTNMATTEPAVPNATSSEVPTLILNLPEMPPLESSSNETPESPSDETSPKDVPLSTPAETVGDELWRGSVSDERLLAMAPPDGMIRNMETWQWLWKYWGGGVVAPVFDPTTQIAMVATVPGHKTLGTPLIWPDGRVEFAVRGTTEECEGFGFQIALIPSQGVRRINGQAYSKTPMEWVCGEILIPSELETFTNAKMTISLYRTGSRPGSHAQRIATCESQPISHEQRERDKTYGFGLGTQERVRAGVTYYVILTMESETFRVRRYCNVDATWTIRERIEDDRPSG